MFGFAVERWLIKEVHMILLSCYALFIIAAALCRQNFWDQVNLTHYDKEAARGDAGYVLILN